MFYFIPMPCVSVHDLNKTVQIKESHSGLIAGAHHLRFVFSLTIFQHVFFFLRFGVVAGCFPFSFLPGEIRKRHGAIWTLLLQNHHIRLNLRNNFK
jgi:hypothetical protein